MMTLYEAARVFDSFVFEDVFDSTFQFAGQFLPFPDSRNSGPSTRRRILETAPDQAMPPRGTIKETASGEVYIVAGPSNDFFRDEQIRTKRPITPSQGLFNVGTPGEVLASTFSSDPLYLDLNYIRRFVNEDKAFYENGYEMVFSHYYFVPRGSIFTNASKYYQTMQDSHVEHSGFEIVETVELYSPITTATIVTQGTTYNPVTDSYNSTTYTNVSIFVVNGVLDFEHESLGSLPIETGDKTISVRKSTAALLSIGSKIGNYRVLSMTDKGTYWSCHARKV